MVSPTQCSLIILSGTPIDIQGVHSRKAQDNSTTNTVLGSLHATTVRESIWSRTASSLLKRNLGTSSKTQMWPGTTRTNSEMLCRVVILPSIRHHLPGHLRHPIAWNRWNSYWGTCN